MKLFTMDVEVINWLLPYRYWIALIPLGAFACYIWDGVFIGLTASHEMRDTMLISLTVYLLTFTFLNSHHENAIWISLAVFLLFRGLLQYAWWRGKIRNQVFAT